MRRAEYCEGGGRLWVSAARLLFVSTGNHPVVAKLEAAARGDRPGRAVAAVVIAAGFDVPPFVFAEDDERLSGIVCGDIQLQVGDSDGSVIDGTEADPWAQINSSSAAAVSLDGGGVDGGLWLDSGVVLAGGFRWSPSPDGAAAEPSPSNDPRGRRAPSAPATDGTDGEPEPAPVDDEPKPASADDEAQPLEPAPMTLDAGYESAGTAPTARADGPARSEDNAEANDASAANQKPGNDGQATGAPRRTPLIEALDIELDTTIDALRFAEIRDDSDSDSPARPRRRASPAQPSETPTETAPSAPTSAGSEPAAESEGPTAEPDATVGLEPGQVMLDGPPVERRMVQSLVCLECQNPNPPVASRCRRCAAFLSSANTDVREVLQPALGMIHLSGGQRETLDTDLLIGRNPARGGLGRYQRAVVHAEQDRSVSRRHIELRLAGWRVMATSLKKGMGTTVESRDGTCANLVSGVPRELRSGDTVYYGGAWLRFEAGE